MSSVLGVGAKEWIYMHFLYLYMHARLCTNHWPGKQMQAVECLRVKLQSDTILSIVTLPASFCLSSLLSPSGSLSFFFPPSVPLGNSSLIKKKKWVWPQINPSAYLSDPRGGKKSSPQPQTLTSGYCWQLQINWHVISKLPDATPDLPVRVAKYRKETDN